MSIVPYTRFLSTAWLWRAYREVPISDEAQEALVSGITQLSDGAGDVNTHDIYAWAKKQEDEVRTLAMDALTYFD